MSISSLLNTFMADYIPCKKPFTSLNDISKIIAVLDFTLLDTEADKKQLQDFLQKALHHNVAAVCVYPFHLPVDWSDKSIKKATVINFPLGNELLEANLNAIEFALEKQVDEIDYVFDYQSYQNGNSFTPLENCKKIIQFCRKHQLTSKIILETSTFPSLDMIYKLSKKICELGCDYIKTSTGTLSHGADLSSAFAILAAIRDSNRLCGIKISGGIKNTDQALNYISLAEYVFNKEIDASWFRIGASRLLDELSKYQS